jgi:2-dehydro-3-deoxyphosphogalactonate aldolase
VINVVGEFWQAATICAARFAAISETTMGERSSLQMRFAAANDKLPLVAVLRGIKPEEAEAVGKTLYGAGFRMIEVPLNSPSPLASVSTLRRTLPSEALIGAGTVLTCSQVSELQACGGEMVFMPHTDVEVIRAAKEAGLLCVPGVATPTEAFAALRAGADALKLFPAGDLITPKVVKAIRVVLPEGTRLLPFGGITPDTMKSYLDAGAKSFGVGAALYKPGMSCDEILQRARAFAAAWSRLSQGEPQLA